MGHDLASSGKSFAVGKQSLASASEVSFSTPGKATLTESLSSSVEGEVAQVARHAGARVVDRARFEYVVTADGAFDVVFAPPPHSELKARITIDKLPGVWGILHDLLLAQKPAPAAPKAAAPIVDDEKRVRSKTQTVEGGTLDVAKTRADLGNAGTHYKRENASTAEVDAMVNGNVKAATFWCSGFSMWTLRAAGYDLDAEVHGSDGKPYTFTGIVRSTKAEDVAKGRARASLMKQIKDANIELEDDQLPSYGRITFRMLIDGHGLPVMVMAKVDRERIDKGGWLGIFVEPANTFAGLLDGPDGPERAATGAPGAFELLGVGHMVTEVEQKPGDFAQERWKNDAGVYNGAGHAFQVWTVKARGSAMFGEPGSPIPVDDAVTGWADGVEFRITKDTDPTLVGAHTVIAVERIEANIEDAFAADTKTKGGGDGGVQIRGEQPVPNVNRLRKGTKVFIGRLSSSLWSSWKPATKPAP